MNDHIFLRRGTRATEPREQPRIACVPDRRFRADDGFECFVPQPLVDRMVAFAERDAPNEWGGLVAVRRLVDREGAYVRVEGVLPFDGARSTPSRLTTTPAAERSARELLERLYPGSVVGGWVHSHPGHGLFFSFTDRTTQRTWTDPRAVAVVVDPSSAEQIAVYRGPRSERMLTVDTTPDARRATPPIEQPGRETEREGSRDDGARSGDAVAAAGSLGKHDGVPDAEPTTHATRPTRPARARVIVLGGALLLASAISLGYSAHLRALRTIAASVQRLDEHVRALRPAPTSSAPDGEP